LKKINYNDEEFCLIKKEALMDIKTENNYSQLIKFFNGKIKNPMPNERDIYNIIKSLSPNQLNELILNLNQINTPKAPVHMN